MQTNFIKKLYRMSSRKFAQITQSCMTFTISAITPDKTVILNKFNVKMLKAICKHFELSFTSKSLKVDLIDKIMAMVAECSCSSVS